MTKQANMLGLMTITIVAMISLVTCTDGNSVEAQLIADQGGFGNMNTTLSHAIIIAEESVGNNSSAIAAFGKDQTGQLVYSIILGTPQTEFYEVTIDPRNGQVLAVEELSQEELEKRHLEHSQKVLEQPHLMNNTFVH